MKISTNKILIVSLFMITISITIIYYWFKVKTESMSSNSNVVFIIPTTSRNMNYQNVDSCALINILYASLKKLDISKYKFIIGMDDDDEFYLNNIDEIKSRLPSNFHFHFLNNFDKSYVCIVNQLADKAIHEHDAEYLYVFADDLDVYQLDFIQDFIEYFKNNSNLCLGWGIDDGNHRICTHPFLHKNHIELLGYFYPKEIKNWYCDDWVTLVYTKLNKITKSNMPVFTNTMIAKEVKRYDIVEVNNLDSLVDLAVDVLSK